MMEDEYDDDMAEPDIDLENTYYNAKALKEDDPRAALESFQTVCYVPLFMPF